MMLKVAFQMGLDTALNEAGLTKEAFGAAWKAMSPLAKGLTTVGGAGAATGLGYGGYRAFKDDEPPPGFLEQAGDVAHGLTSDPKLMSALMNTVSGAAGAHGIDVPPSLLSDAFGLPSMAQQPGYAHGPLQY